MHSCQFVVFTFIDLEVEMTTVVSTDIIDDGDVVVQVVVAVAVGVEIGAYCLYFIGFVINW